VSPRDFLILVGICLMWGLANVISKIVVSEWGVPPFAFAAVRFGLVALVTLPWLLPAPKPLGRLLGIAVTLGAGNFALLFVGLQTASPSASAIVVQVGVPITTLLSVLVLGERIAWRRGLGILMTLSGALVVIWNPDGLSLSKGLWFVAGAALAGSVGAVLMKQMPEIQPLRFQAWVGFVSFAVLTPVSLLFETGQRAAMAAAGWPFVAAVLFSALIVSVISHTAHYRLIQRYEANMISPLTLMAPLATIGFGVLITGDRFDLRMGIGAALALCGVLIVALRTRRPGPLTNLLRERS
jgi:drug/metabolite transporter (DMT)-like permease